MAAPRLRAWAVALGWVLAVVALLAAPAAATTLRVALFATDLARKGPGLLLRDLVADAPPEDVTRAVALVQQADPDVLVLLSFDYDAGGAALAAFDRLIGNGTPAYAHQFALRPNTGMATGLDLDGDGRRGDASDAQGFGRFAGQGGMALLSRFPVEAGGAVDLSALLWRDLPGATLPRWPDDGRPFPSPEVQAVQRLSTTGHWAVPLRLPGGQRLTVLAFHATPPAFDGPEQRNVLRATDELRLWEVFLSDGLAGFPAPEGPLLLAGISNLDPDGGGGDSAAMAAVLADPRWQDPPMLAGRPTAVWPPPLGPLRVDYLLPSAGITILGGGLLPADDSAPPVHRLVWLDLHLP